MWVQVPLEAKREHWTPPNWSDNQLSVLGIKFDPLQYAPLTHLSSPTVNIF